MRGCVTEERDSGDYSAEREIRKNRREREIRMDGRFGRRMGEAEMQKCRRRFGKERKRESA